MRQVCVVANPAAGGGRTERLLPAVQATLLAAGHDVTLARTRDLADAEELTLAAVAAGQLVAAMGGDGLIGRVAGAVAASGGLLSVLPGGRGNDFARALGLGSDPVAACAVLRTGTEVALDLAEVDGTPFVGIASLGFDSVVQEIANTTRLPLGGLVYTYATLRGLLRWRHARYRVSLDGDELAMRGWSVAVSNSGVYGGGMRLAPQASLRDGQLDVVLTTATSRLTLLRVLPKVFSGAHVREPSVQIHLAAQVRVEADRDFRVFADGDPVGGLPAVIRVRPGALRTLVPADSPVLAELPAPPGRPEPPAPPSL